jgi:hypothetical protein
MKKFAYARCGQLLSPNRKFTFINTCAGRLANAFFDDFVTCAAVCDKKFCEFAKLSTLGSFHMCDYNCQF